MGCNYENVKLICKIWREEGRIREIPNHIKRFVPELERDPEALRARMTASEFEQIRRDWNNIWREQDSHDQLPILPAVPAHQYLNAPENHHSVKVDPRDPGLVEILAKISNDIANDTRLLKNAWFYQAIARSNEDSY